MINYMGRQHSVEARYNYHDPKVIAGQVYDNRWREVQHYEAPHGIPQPRHKRTARRITDMLTRQEAEALRWWFICAADAGERIGGSLCLETRIVEHKVEYKFSVTPVRYIDAFDMRGDVPKDMATEPEAESI